MTKKEKVKKMFDNIAIKYDFLNHFLSAGIDIYWRKKALKFSNIEPGNRLLDIACGTGDFSITAKKMGAGKIFGADLSNNMLQLFEKKAGWIKGNSVQSTAENPPFKPGSFENIIVAFGVRNFYDIKKSFISFHNILSDSGEVTILEFSLPKSKLIRPVYLFYFHRLLPFIGKIISKDKDAYDYLPESVNEFDSEIDLSKLLMNAGFSKITKYSLTLGIVQLIIAKK